MQKEASSLSCLKEECGNHSCNLGGTESGLANPLISIVLATKGNKVMLLKRCLVSLQKQTFREFEIILIYSIFPDELKEYFVENNIFVLKENGSTLSAARNLGVKHSKGEIVAFIDDDAEAPEDWLSKIYATFKMYPSLSSLGGVHLTPPEEREETPVRFIEASLSSSWMGQKASTGRSAVGKIPGCNVAYRKVIFDKIGYLDETLRSGEDWEFNIRLQENGYMIRFDPTISVWHHRQGLKHAFWNSSKMVPFYLSWKTLKYARYEPLFATFYLTNLLFLLLLITLIISPFIFALFLISLLIGYFVFIAIRAKNRSWRIIYYPLIIAFTLVRSAGFYFGLIRNIKSTIRLKRSSNIKPVSKSNANKQDISRLNNSTHI